MRPASWPSAVQLPTWTPHLLMTSASQHLAELSPGLPGSPPWPGNPVRAASRGEVHVICFSFVLADPLPQPVCITQTCLMSREPAAFLGAGAARCPCEGRLGPGTFRTLANPPTPAPAIASGDRAPCRERKPGPPGHILPASCIPSLHRSPGPVPISQIEAEGGLEL